MEKLYLSRISTLVGELHAAATTKHLIMLEYPNQQRIDKHLATLEKIYELIEGATDITRQLEVELSDYFNGNLTQFSTPIQLIGTDFQKSVWEQIRHIPYGQTRSYQDQSEVMNQPLAIRAIANANGQNKLAIIVPCHRIIGSSGAMTGYSGGTTNKKLLLDLEQGTHQITLF